MLKDVNLHAVRSSFYFNYLHVTCKCVLFLLIILFIPY